MWLSLLLACGAPPAPDVPPSQLDAPAPKTVMMVIGCTFRADRLGAWGNPRDTSPYVDALAAGGARFERVISDAPWTRPGVGALTTGVHPISLGVDDSGEDAGYERGISPDWLNLAERLHAEGWSAVGATANPNANARVGFAQGFDTYLDTGTRWNDGIEKIDGTEVVDAWLDAARQVQGPLYGQIVLVDTHRPLGALLKRRLRLGLWPLSTNIVDRYDAALTATDDAIRRLDQGLRDMGRGDRLMIVAGDHGEGLYLPKHAGRAHAGYLYDANLQVPLLFHGPGVQPGQVVHGLAESVDVAPTLLDLLGVQRDITLDGRSLAAQVRGEREDAGEPEVVSITRYGRSHKARITTRRWTYIHTYLPGPRKARGPDELYAADDRWEQNDLSTEQPAVVRGLRARLEARRGEYERDARPWQAETSDHETEQLRALGYMDDAER